MRIYQRGSTWWSSWTENGATVKRSTRCTSKAAAKLVAEQWERDRADPHSKAANQATFDEEAHRWLKTCELSGKSKATLGIYACKAGNLTALLPKLISELNPNTADKYFEKRREEGASISTMNKEWKVLRAIMRSAKRRNLWQGEIDSLKPEWVRECYVPRERRLTWEELGQLARHLPPHRAAMVRFIVATGARWSEAVRARREDVKADAVFLRGTKTEAAERIVPIASVFRKVLDQALADAPNQSETGPLFSPWLSGNVIRDLRAACDRAGIAWVSPNDLRRTFASLLSDAGAANQVVAKLMGHTSTAIVDRVYNKHTTASLSALLEHQLTVPRTVPPVSHWDSNRSTHTEEKE